MPKCPSLSGRSAIISHLKLAQPRPDLAPDFFDGVGSLHAPSQGITAYDLLDFSEDASHADFFDRLFTMETFALPFAAFLLNGFWIDPDRCNEAARRIDNLKVENDTAREISSALSWLKTQLPRPAEKVEKRTYQDGRFSPQELLHTLQKDDAPPSILPRLIWEAHRLTRAALAVRDQDKIDREVMKEVVALDEGTNRSLQALFLLGVDSGAVDPDLSKISAEDFNKAFENGFTKFKEAVGEGSKLVTPKAPDPVTIKSWLRRAAEGMGHKQAGERGRPAKRKRT